MFRGNSIQFYTNEFLQVAYLHVFYVIVIGKEPLAFQRLTITDFTQIKYKVIWQIADANCKHFVYEDWVIVKAHLHDDENAAFSR